MSTKDNYLLLFSKRLIPDRRLSKKIFNYFVLLKIIPVFILTHDWDIGFNQKHRGISSFIAEITLGPLFYKIRSNNIEIVLILLFFIFSVFPLVMLLYYFNLSRKQIHFSDRLLTVYIAILYLCPFFLNQHIYMFTVEVIFCEDRGWDILFLFKCVIQCVFSIYCVVLSFYLSILSFSPRFLGDSIIVANINHINYKWNVFPFFQAITQLEYHISHDNMILVKAIARGIFVLFFFYIIATLDNQFLYKKYKFLYAFFALCFSSCIIEFPFVYKREEDHILTSSPQIITIKLFIEVCLTGIIVSYIKKKEENSIIYLIKNLFIDDRLRKNENFNLYILNKFFFHISNINNKGKIDSHFNSRLINELSSAFSKHKENCDKDECFCIKYNSDEFKKEYLGLVNEKKNGLIKSKGRLKEIFPILFDMLESFLIHNLGNSKIRNYGQFYLLCAIFYLKNDNNFSKPYYYLEEYNSFYFHESSFIFKIQFEILKMNLKNNLKEYYGNSSQLYNSHLKISNLIQYIKLEILIRKSFDSYYNFLINFQVLDLKKKGLEDEMIKVFKTIRKYHKKVKILIYKCCEEYQGKCELFQLTTKLLLYYSFFYGKPPKYFYNLFKKLENFGEMFQLDTSKQIIFTLAQKGKNINENVNSHSLINIDYLSDSLYLSLGYDNITEARQITKISDIVAFENFSLSYEEYLVKKILNNQMKITIPYMILTHKNHEHLQIYSFESFLFLTDKKLSLFGRFKDEEPKNSCFAILDSLGYIVGLSFDFYRNFFLNMRTLSQHKVNLFHDILHISSHEIHKKNLFFNLLKLYQNINSVASNLLIETNDEYYSKVYQYTINAIGKLEKGLNKPDSNKKLLEVNVNFINCVAQKEKYIIAYFIFDLKNKYDFTKKNKSILIKKDNHCDYFHKDNENFELHVSKDRKDLLVKINLIKEQALTVLFYLYGMNLRVLNEFASVGKEKDKKVEKIKVIVQKEDKYISLNSRTKFKIRLQMRITVLFMFLFLFLTFFIFFYRIINFNQGIIIVKSQLLLITLKKIISSIISSAMGIQLQVNNLQGDIYDNNFNNSYDVHMEMLNYRISDLIEIVKSFKNFYYSESFQAKKYSKTVNKFLMKSRTFNFMDKNFKLMKYNGTLGDFLNFLHLRLSKFNYNKISPTTFNRTDNSYYIEGKSILPSLDNNSLLPEGIMIYLLDNSLTSINYLLIEIINYFGEIAQFHINDTLNYIFFIFISFGLAKLIITIFQTFCYSILSREIYIKWFINVCYLKYFYIFLLQKINLIRKTIDFGTIESIIDLYEKRIEVVNSKEENQLLIEENQLIDYEYEFGIVPFKGNFESSEKKKFDNEEKKRKFVKQSLLSKKPKMESRKSLSQKNLGKSCILSSSFKNNTTGDSFITSTLKESQPIQNQKNKQGKFVVKVNEYKNSIAFLIIGIVTIVVSVFQYAIVIPQFNLLKQFSKQKSATLFRLDFFHQILLSYELSILKNSPLLCEFESEGFLNSTPLLYDFNNQTTHEVFIENIEQFKEMANQFEEVIGVTSTNCYQKTLVKFEQEMRKDNPCKAMVNFFKDNSRYLTIPIFENMNFYDFEQTIKDCGNIGRGYNSKGINSMLNSLIGYIEIKYKDFKAMGDKRDEEYNLNLFNEQSFQTFQVNTNYIINILFFDYEICLNMDYEHKYKTFKTYDLILLVFIIVYAFIVEIIYLKVFTHFFLKKNEYNEKLEHLLINTVVS